MSDLRAGGAYVEIYAKNEQLQLGIEEAERRLRLFHELGRKVVGTVATGTVNLFKGIPLALQSSSLFSISKVLGTIAGNQLVRKAFAVGIASDFFLTLGLVRRSIGGVSQAIKFLEGTKLGKMFFENAAYLQRFFYVAQRIAAAFGNKQFEQIFSSLGSAAFVARLRNSTSLLGRFGIVVGHLFTISRRATTSVLMYLPQLLLSIGTGGRIAAPSLMGVSNAANAAAAAADKSHQSFHKWSGGLSGFGAAAQRVAAWSSGIVASMSAMAGIDTTKLWGKFTSIQGFAPGTRDMARSAERVGVDPTVFSEMAAAAKIVGASQSDLEAGLQSSTRLVADAAAGSEYSTKVLNQLGLSVSQLRRLSPDGAFISIARAVAAISDPTQRATAAMDALGYSGADLLPLATRIQQLRQESRALGASMSREDVAAARSLSEAIARLSISATGFAYRIGAIVAPSVEGVVSRFVTMGSAVIRLIENNKDLINVAFNVAGSFASVVGGVYLLTKAYSVLSPAVSATRLALSFGVSLLTSPWGMLAVAIGVATVAFLRFTETGRSTLAWLSQGFGYWFTEILSSWGAVINALNSGNLEAAWAVVMAQLNVGVESFKFNVTGTFHEIKNRVIPIWSDMGFAIQSSWATALGTMRKMHAGWVGQIANEMLRLYGIFDRKFDVAGALKQSNQMTSNAMKQINDDQKRANAAIEKARTEDERKRLEEQDKALKKRRQALESAQKELNAARDRANAAVPSAGIAGGGKYATPGKGSPLASAQIAQKPSDERAQLADLKSKEGLDSFLASLVGASGPQDEVASNTAQIAANSADQLKEITDLRKDMKTAWRGGQIATVALEAA